MWGGEGREESKIRQKLSIDRASTEALADF